MAENQTPPPATPPPATPPAAQPAPEPTPEELKQTLADIVNVAFPASSQGEKIRKRTADARAARDAAAVEAAAGTPPAPEVPPAAEPVPPASPPAEPAPAAAAPPAAPPPAAPPPPAAKPPTTQPVVPPAPVLPPVAPAAAAPPAPTVAQWTPSPREVKHLAALEKLQEIKPDLYPGIADRSRAFFQAQKAYIAKWESENPGQEFDADADIHADFYKRNEPQVDPDDMDDAKEALLVQKMKREVGEVSEEVRQEVALKQAEPEIHRKAAAAVTALVTESLREVDPELFREVSPTGTPIDLSPEFSAKLADEDPAAFSILTSHASTAASEMAEFERLHNHGVPIDPNNKVHTSIINKITHMDRILTALPPEQALGDGGRRYISMGDFNKHISAISEQHANPASREAAISDFRKSYWTIEYDTAKQVILGATVTAAKKELQELQVVHAKRSEKLAARKAKGNPPPAAPAATPPPTPPSTKPQTPPPPAAVTSSDTVDTSGARVSAPTLSTEKVSSVMWPT